MKDLLNRVQQHLNENTAVEAEDIQALVDYAKNYIDKTPWLNNHMMTIENHNSGQRDVIVCPDAETMHDKLIDKGFTYYEGTENYCGFNKAGEEISVYSLQPRHVDDLKQVYKS